MPATIQFHSQGYVTVPGFWMKSQKASLEWFYKATCNNMVPVTVGTEKLEDIKEDKWQCLIFDFLID